MLLFYYARANLRNGCYANDTMSLSTYIHCIREISLKIQVCVMILMWSVFAVPVRSKAVILLLFNRCLVLLLSNVGGCVLTLVL